MVGFVYYLCLYAFVVVMVFVVCSLCFVCCAEVCVFFGLWFVVLLVISVCFEFGGLY